MVRKRSVKYEFTNIYNSNIIISIKCHGNEELAFKILSAVVKIPNDFKLK